MTSDALATIISSAITAIGGALAGRQWGGRGKKRRLGKLPTGINIHNTTWTGAYEDTAADGDRTVYRMTLKLKQYGSRIVGDASDEEGSYTWTIEGLVHRGKICYVYVADDRNVVSTGAVTLELTSDGKTLRGQWAGWSPDGTKLEPQAVSLVKI